MQNETNTLSSTVTDSELSTMHSPLSTVSDARALFRSSSALAPNQPTPWPEPVIGSHLLDELVATFNRFLVTAKWIPETIALWIVHTYAYRLRDVSTYLGIESPAHRCGKTTLLALLNQLAHRTLTSANVSSPAFFHAIEELEPTLLIDEADTFLKGKHEIKGILNAGYTRDTGYVMRVVPDRRRRRESSSSSIPPSTRLARYSCWCPKAIARIGSLPETLADRCIIIRMQRKTSNERCERLRKLNPADLKSKCLRFVLDHSTQIAAAEPAIPEDLNDRAADIWEPLFVLADLAGGHWPQTAREAALALSATALEAGPIASLLLDIFCLFTLSQQTSLFTRELLDALNVRAADRPWSLSLRGGKVTDIWLSRQLRSFDIRPRSIWRGQACAKGYVEEDFHDTFRRYITKSDFDSYMADRRRSAGRSSQPGTASVPPAADGCPT